MAERTRLRGVTGTRWPRVTVTGHRPSAFAPDERDWVIATLPQIVRQLRDAHDTTTYLSGLALGVDSWWADAVLDAGQHLWAYVPFEAQSERWPEGARRHWATLRQAATREVVLGAHYSVRLLHARNDLLVRDADAVVAVHHPSQVTGGTVSVIRKARQAGLPVIRVNPASREVHLYPTGWTSPLPFFAEGRR